VGKAPGSKVLSEKPIDVEGYAGREFVIQTPRDGTLVTRVILVERRLYTLATNSRGGAEAGNVRRFLDSFKLISRVTTPAQIDGLLGYWSFDDDDPERAKDTSGGGNHALLKNATRVPGKLGQAI